MDRAIINCDEEEFAPFFAHLWRRSEDWQPVLLYGRGPGGLGLFSSLLLTATGIWRFARRPRKLIDNQSQFVGQPVLEICTHLGSYGMGGPGFFGLRFATGWIVYRLWGASRWLTLNGSLLEDSLFPDERATHSNLINSGTLKTTVLEGITCSESRYDLTFSTGHESLLLSLRCDGSSVPNWRGNGQPKVLSTDERLEESVVVSRRGRLWLQD